MKTTKTKIALVNTPLLEGAGDHPLFPPLGLAYMAAVLEQNGFEIKVFDCPIYGIDHEKLKAELSVFQPTIVGVGAMTQTFDALKTAYAAKEACPDAKVVMGGPHATFQDKEILSQEKVVDIIVRGEGEETLLELAKQPELQNINEIKGVTFRKDNQIVQTPTRPFIQNLDALPRPAYKQIPIEKYRINGKRILPVISSRGCPFQCSFCVASEMFGRTFRARSPNNVLDEIEWLKNEFGAEGIQFQDDTLTF
ncbi:MAG: radical SAM protein, partial [Candidatus Bathyarchaeia archaeon]